jgi:type IV pilus assembly protein PilN
MRITLNLASKPFIELRPLYTRLRLVMAALLVLAIPLWFLLRAEERKAAQSTAKLQAIQNQIQRLQAQQSSYQAMMRQPPNAAVLNQAVFLNQLFAEKGFSWTAVMMDLETVLPGGVQVMNIDPAIDKSGNVTVRLRVNGQREHAVDLIRNLEHSKRFLQPRLASETLETSTTGNQNLQPTNGPLNVNFDVLAEYNPLPPQAAAKNASKSEAKSAEKNKSAADAAAPSKPKSPTPHPPHKPSAPVRTKNQGVQ